MADFSPMLTAIREVCRGALGSVRVVQSNALRERAYPSTTEHEAARVIVGPRFEVSVSKADVSKESPWENSPIRLLDVEVRVRTEWSTKHELLDDERSAVRASALALLEDMRAALMRPGNLATTASGQSSGLVSGCLHRHSGHSLEREDWQRRRLSYVSTYSTVMRIAQNAG